MTVELALHIGSIWVGLPDDIRQRVDRLDRLYADTFLIPRLEPKDVEDLADGILALSMEIEEMRIGSENKAKWASFA